MKKLLSIIMILIICVFAFSVNKRFQTIDDLAYVIAIGIDTSNNNNLKVSFQIAIPSQDSGSNSSSGSSEGSKSNYTISTIDATSLNSAKTLANTFISKQINLSHCKVVVISEEYASAGIADLIYTLINDIEVRPDCNLIISTSDAKSLLENSTPYLESLPSKYYEIIPSSSEYTGYSNKITISDFFYSLTDTYEDPHAILGTVNTKNSNSQNSQNSSSATHNTNMENNLYPLENASNIDSDQSGIIMNGTAVFDGDKLVGELNSIETLCLLITTNDLKRSIISIQDPFHEDNIIELLITPNKKTKHSVELLNGSANVETKVNLKANILSMSSDSNYSEAQNLEAIEEYVNSYLESEISAFLYRTSREFRSDISGIGKNVVGKFLTLDEWKNYNWLDNYQNCFFSVNVDTSVKSGYLLVKS